MLSIARPLVVVALLPFLVAAGGLRSFHHDAMKVRGFEAPIGWEQQPAGSYPRLLAQWETKDGGRMTLVAQKVRAGLDAHGLAAQSQPALERQGFRAIAIADERPSGDDSERVRLDAAVDDGHRFVRQLYVVADGIGYVLTMVGPIGRAPQMRRDFDDAAASLTVGD